MPQIIPIKSLKNTAEISDMCHNTQEPIFITKNGYGDMVLMSMEHYERMMQRERMYQDLDISEQQLRDGKVKDAKQALQSVRKRYGL